MTLQEVSLSSPTVRNPSHPEIDTQLNLSNERFVLGLPNGQAPDTSYGLVLFLSPSDNGTPPADWLPVLAEKKLLLLSPKNVGNAHHPRRRMAVGLLGAQSLVGKYGLNPKRVYAAGTSGGARVASALAFFRPDLFSGTIQSVGSNYPRPIPLPSGAKEDGYGLMSGGETIDAAAVRSRVRFVLITSPTDFRHANLQAIYQQGFVVDGFATKFLDVPGMGHSACGAMQLREALDFIEKR